MIAAHPIGGGRWLISTDALGRLTVLASDGAMLGNLTTHLQRVLVQRLADDLLRSLFDWRPATGAPVWTRSGLRELPW